jgi:hypothetical protein
MFCIANQVQTFPTAAPIIAPNGVLCLDLLLLDLLPFIVAFPFVVLLPPPPFTVGSGVGVGDVLWSGVGAGDVLGL